MFLGVLLNDTTIEKIIATFSILFHTELHDGQILFKISLRIFNSFPCTQGEEPFPGVVSPQQKINKEYKGKNSSMVVKVSYSERLYSTVKFSLVIKKFLSMFFL